MEAYQQMLNAGYLIESLMHIGANVGQERHEYAAIGASPCIYVEPISKIVDVLESNLQELPGHRAVKALCSDRDGQIIDFNIASNGGESSSMFALGDHSINYPHVNYVGTESIETEKLDTLIRRLNLKKVPNLLVVDTQGADLKVLKGGVETLKQVDGIFVEVSETPLYEKGCTFAEITKFLAKLSFNLRWLSMNRVGHGNAFYCRDKKAADQLPMYDGNLAYSKKARQSSLSAWSKPDDACGAVNGIRNGHFGFHTEEEDCPWWEIDLAETQRLNEVRVYNRLDSGRQRSRSLQISVSSDGDEWRTMHDQMGYTFGGIDGKPLRVRLDGEYGRFIRLSLTEKTALHLDEVEIY